ncbi:hypothetical protein R1sor_020923 [Riccia sorocarpa]|uniref:Endonuclease/exonuclease/phosphatase domain-containing protein n=1 Tax=Riccia sorocarpa TaxID=122646 RepID=A0ABD3GHD1_9MARC
MYTTADFKVASWNLNGAADPDRVRAIRQWLRKRKDLEILAFQELKAKEAQADWNLRSIYPNGRVVIDYAENERGGAAIVVSEAHTVVNSGIRGDGSATWVQIQTPSNGVVEDTQGTSNLLNGAELRRWKELSRAAELTDCFFTTVTKRGPRFTRQRVRLDRIEFARLDRIYVSEGADWVESVRELNHDGSSGLSDHYPVVGEFQLAPVQNNSGREWRTYFKFRAEEMRSEIVRTQVEHAWKAHPLGVTDPRVKWELSWKRVKKLMQKRRKEIRDLEVGEETLKSSLEKLITSIAQENTLENRKRLASLELQVKERELETQRHGDFEAGPGGCGRATPRLNTFLPSSNRNAREKRWYGWSLKTAGKLRTEIPNKRVLYKVDLYLTLDDMGLILRAEEENWNRATEVVRGFELLSGTKLNVSKSLVVPIGFTDPPEWLRRTGCKMATEGEVWTYLDYPFGVNLSEEQVMQFLLDKLTVRLNHWSNRFLSWKLSRSVERELGS